MENLNFRILYCSIFLDTYFSVSVFTYPVPMEECDGFTHI